MLLRILTLALGTIALAAACGGDDDDSGVGDFANSVVRERDGITLTVASDRKSYGEGQQVFIRATVSNGSGAAVLYGSDTGILQEQAVTVTVPTLLGGEPVLPPVDDSEAAATGGTLEPADEFTSEVVWDRILPTYTTPVEAPEGPYSATAVVLVKPEGAAEAIELSAVVEFTLETGDPVASPEIVLQAAVAQPEVKDWFEGRQTNVMCAYGVGEIVYNVDVTTGAMAETFQELYNNALAQGDPICSPVTEGDTWRVIFSDSIGDPPNRVSAILELGTADFIRFEEGAPTPAPATPQ